MEIIEIFDNFEEWDELVNNSPHGTIFHRSDWLTLCSNLMKKKFKIYGCFEKNKIIGGCSLFIHKLNSFKIATSSSDFIPYGGLIFSGSDNSVRGNEKKYNTFINSLCEKLDKEHFDRIHLVNSPDFIDVRPFTREGWQSQIFYAYFLYLNIYDKKHISRDARESIQRAIKNNIRIRKLNDSSIAYKLFSMTFERQGLKPLVTENFFEKVLDLIEERHLGQMWVAEIPSGETINAVIHLWDNKRAYGWVAASHTDFKNLGSEILILDESFIDLKNKGFKEVDIMSANTPRLAAFNSKLNPTLVPYYGVEKTTLLYKCSREAYSFYGKIKNYL